MLAVTQLGILSSCTECLNLTTSSVAVSSLSSGNALDKRTGIPSSVSLKSHVLTVNVCCWKQCRE